MSNALGRRLDAIKEHGGIKGTDIAQLMDTTPETVSRWSRGKVDPRPDRLKRLLTLEWVMDQLAELYEPGRGAPVVVRAASTVERQDPGGSSAGRRFRRGHDHHRSLEGWRLRLSGRDVRRYQAGFEGSRSAEERIRSP